VVTDPVCNMDIDEKKVEATSKHNEKYLGKQKEEEDKP
jgi:YHS domain-containing protein